MFRGPKTEGTKEVITFFYDIEAILGWNLDRWRWVEGFGSSTVRRNSVGFGH